MPTVCGLLAAAAAAADRDRVSQQRYAVQSAPSPNTAATTPATTNDVVSLSVDLLELAIGTGTRRRRGLAASGAASSPELPRPNRPTPALAAQGGMSVRTRTRRVWRKGEDMVAVLLDSVGLLGARGCAESSTSDACLALPVVHLEVRDVISKVTGQEWTEMEADAAWLI
ncbi:uncharacterized protein BXZ73DRAFT_75002 [Epithele typhae]|uniref:uncharacterized protein n=1 Tax=Epithele typhae TaxID=378194 RepID=UPI0020089177|nr:uncharacterized protein BXZ73DRAFT_75002 [Epithele typhae]KAH9941822.1 hypothetical protein BXZ73DRAFT_75002 [Epithele typhae]